MGGRSFLRKFGHIGSSLLHSAHCSAQDTLHIAPEPAHALVQVILQTKHCTPHVYTACCTFITSNCKQPTVVVEDGKMNPNLG